MKVIIFLCVLIFSVSPGYTENYLLNGGQESKINYRLVQEIQPSSNIRKLVLNYVVPVSFNSPTYNQNITDLDLRFHPEPAKKTEKTDKRGNKVIEATWMPPLKDIKATVSLTAKNNVDLKTINTTTPFPVKNITDKVKVYLKPTKQVSSANIEIIKKARELTVSSKTEFDAVQKILTWVVDHMHYVLRPKSYNSLYSLKSGKGNCQNYSHLSAALMRSVGIPVRIVNGITLKQPYDIKIKRSILTMKMAQGRHSWIEVFFPDLGWVPFDAQGTELFVSNRFIRVEVGLDNNETEQDGLMRWTRLKGSKDKPSFGESISADFMDDKVDLNAEKTKYGPREMLLSPKVKSTFSMIPLVPHKPQKFNPQKVIKTLDYSRPFLFGNLDFPENEDFLSTRGPAEEGADGTMKMKKNFLVETAEYVTTKGQQYAQTFILNEPIKLQKIGLALHKFGTEGQLWLELYKDNNGKPGEHITTSDIFLLNKVKYKPGYSWFDFSFEDSSRILPQGRYWIALGFTGSPIVNWFFTYGKPVGPHDGTRYKKMFDEDWGRRLSFEFNYRVKGLAAK